MENTHLITHVNKWCAINYIQAKKKEKNSAFVPFLLGERI